MSLCERTKNVSLWYHFLFNLKSTSNYIAMLLFFSVNISSRWLNKVRILRNTCHLGSLLPIVNFSRYCTCGGVGLSFHMSVSWRSLVGLCYFHHCWTFDLFLFEGFLFGLFFIFIPLLIILSNYQLFIFFYFNVGGLDIDVSVVWTDASFHLV